MRRHPVLLAAAIMLAAFNLRPPVASVGPVLPELRQDLGLSGAGTALLTMLPVLCFGLLAVAAPRLAKRVGMEPVLMVVLLTLVVALIGRVLDGPGLLFAGTLLVGGAIAVGNVLVPPLIKRDFPAQTGLMMGVYTMTVSGSAAVAAGATVPLGDLVGMGWRGALGVWTVPAVIAAVAWFPLLRAHTRPPPAAVPSSNLLHNPLAWQVTIFFGMQSLSFYAVLSWLPSIYRDLGYSAAAAGLLLSVSGLVQVPVALALPAIASRAANQVIHLVVSTAFIGAGLAGILLAPTAAPYLWMALVGIGHGGSFALALSLFVLRTRRVAETARLSAMAQSIGYVLAASGPFAIGIIHEVTRSWTPPLVMLLLLLVPQLWSGALAGRARWIEDHRRVRPTAAVRSDE